MSSKFGLNPWATIWTQPRKTIRAIVENNPKYHFFYLATIYALQTLLILILMGNFSKHYNIITLLAISVVVAPFLGAIFIYFNSWILHFTGKWLKGVAPFINIRAALSWSKAPSLILVLMWFIILVLSPEIIVNTAKTPTILFIYLIVLISRIWEFIILLKSIQEVQKFSIWNSYENIILAYIISTATLFVLRGSLTYLVFFFSS